MRRLLILQIIMVSLVSAGAGMYAGPLAVKASLFGGMIALLNTGLMMLHEKRAVSAGQDAQRILKYIYLCAVERMILSLGLFAMGLVALKLLPLQLFLGFIAGQVAAFLNGLSH